jgi:hypothetical protein
MSFDLGTHKPKKQQATNYNQLQMDEEAASPFVP